jgi:hypothetical protein
MAYANTKFKLNNGAEIPAVGFGTWQDKDAQEDAVYEALKAGYRHIDTARMYVAYGSRCARGAKFSTAMAQSQHARPVSKRVASLERTFSSPPSYGTTLTTQTTLRRPVTRR